jgi:hypothetical protein
MYKRRLSRILGTAAAILAGLVAPLFVWTSPASAATSLVQVSATSATASPEYQAAVVTCPANTKLLGGGADVIGGGHSVWIYMLDPNSQYHPPHTLVAAAEEDAAGYAGLWSITVYAICGTGVTGYTIATSTTVVPPGYTSGNATAVCPVGTKVIGAGGSTYKSRSVLDTIITNPLLSAVTVEAFRNEADPGTYSIGVNAFAICINPLPTMQLVSATSGYTSDDKVVSVTCPAGTKVHGVLGSLTGAGGQAYIDALAPYATMTGVIFNAREDATGHGGNWTAWVYAVCA